MSAAVTFLSFPGLVGIARIAGLITTLFASFSIAATLVAIFRYKADLVRNAPQIGEGLMWVSVSRAFKFDAAMIISVFHNSRNDPLYSLFRWSSWRTPSLVSWLRLFSTTSKDPLRPTCSLYKTVSPTALSGRLLVPLELSLVS